MALPRDDAGRMTSIGGLLHASGRCRPCRDMIAGHVCGKGMRCCFCHYPHDPIPRSVVDMDVGDQRRGGARPCKSQREEYRRYVAEIEERIHTDPWSFDPTTLALPPRIFDGRPEVKSKFLMRLSAMADRLKGEAARSANATTASIRQAGPSASSGQAGPSVSSSHAGPSSSCHEALPVRRRQCNIVHL